MSKRAFDLTNEARKEVINPLTSRRIKVGSAIFNKLRTHEGFEYNQEANLLTKRVATYCEDEVKELSTVPPRKVQKMTTLLSTAHVRKTEILDIVDAPTVLLPPACEFDTIAHISDVHVPSNLFLARRIEYEAVFATVYSRLQTLAESRTLCIVVTGDLVHTKLDVQNETNEVARNFVAKLGQIAPTVVIIGNHDFLEHNKDRVDSLSVIVDRIPNVFGVKTTGLYSVGNLTFAFSSLFDNKFIPYPVAASALAAGGGDDPAPTVYALYHGTVHGSVNCNKRVNTSGGHGSFELLKMGDFAGYTGCLFGHIHLQQQLENTAWYAGSLIQQNFGEAIDGHGFLVWDLIDKIVVPCEISNSYAMLNVRVEDGKLTEESEKALALYSSHDDEDANFKQLSLKCKCYRTTELQYKSLVNTLTTTMPNIIGIKLANSLAPSLLKGADMGANSDSKEGAEEEEEEEQTLLEREHTLLRKYTVLQGTKIEDLITFHDTVVHQVQSSSPLEKCNADKSMVQWTIESARFRNMLRYGDDHINNVNFGTDGGIFNVSEDNQAGKTSISCILMFGLFGRIGRTDSPQKNDLLHHGTKEGFIEVTFRRQGVSHKITREFYKRGPGAPKITVEFVRLNADGTTTRLSDGPKTQQRITELIGEFDTFALLQVVSNNPALSQPLLYMTPGAKYTNLINLCQIEQYTAYDTEAKNTCARLAEQCKHLEFKLQGFESTAKELSSSYLSKDDDNGKITTVPAILERAKKCLDEQISQVEQHLQEHSDEHSALIERQTRHALHVAKWTTILSYVKDLVDLSENDTSDVDDTASGGSGSSEVCLEDVQAKARHIWDLKIASEGLNSQRESILAECSDGTHIALLEQKLQLEEAAQNACVSLAKYSTQELMCFQARFREFQHHNFAKEYESQDGVACTDGEDGGCLLERVVSHCSAIEVKLMNLQRKLMDVKKPVSSDQLIITTTLSKTKCHADIFAQECTNAFAVLDSQLAKLRTCHSEDDRLSVDHAKLIAIFDEMKYKGDICSNFTVGKLELVKIFVANTVAGNYQEQIQRKLDIVACECAQDALQLAGDTIRCDFRYLSDALFTFEAKVAPEIVKELGARNAQQKLERINNAIALCQKVDDNQRELEHHLGDLSRMAKQCKQLLQLELSAKALVDSAVDVGKLQTRSGEMHKLPQDLAKLRHDLGLAMRVSTEYTTCNDACVIARSRLVVCQEYRRLVGKSGIPFRIVDSRMEEFKHRVNMIFGRYAPYRFDLCIEHGKQGSSVRFDMTHKTTNVSMEPARLCGFEAVVLRMAVNFAALALSRRSQCTFLIVDEAIDCMSANNYLEELPRIIEAVKPFYPTMLIISHREIRSSVVDERLRIRVNDANTSSFINN